jgi:hypothetical protein
MPIIEHLTALWASDSVGIAAGAHVGSRLALTGGPLPDV